MSLENPDIDRQDKHKKQTIDFVLFSNGQSIQEATFLQDRYTQWCTQYKDSGVFVF